MSSNLIAELDIPSHDASLRAVLAFFCELSDGLGVSRKIRGEVELALEEGLSNFFKYALPVGDKSPVHLKIEFTEDAIRLIARAPGRPFDFSRLPHYRPMQSLEDSPQGLGLFLIEKFMDSVHWRYLEKHGQEFEMLKHLPAPLALQHQENADKTQAAPRSIHGEIRYKRLETYEEALTLASAAWDLYGYGYKDVIYYPEKMVEQCRSGQILSWIAVDEANTVVGHYAMMRHEPRGPLGEMGAAFVYPELRMAGVFRQISDHLHADARKTDVRGLFSLSVTNHIATQKSSEAMGRRSVAIHLASTPAIFVENAKPDDRITTVFNYQQLVPRSNRLVYLPVQHREIIMQSYDWLGLAVTDGNLCQKPDSHNDAILECYRDLAWNRAQISASGGEAVRYKLAAFTDSLVEQGVAAIILLVDLEDPSAPEVVTAAEKLGYFYSGISPETGREGRDVLKLQFLNGIKLNPEDIKLHQPSARILMDYIRQQNVVCFN